jgi:hypothetical protein
MNENGKVKGTDTGASSEDTIADFILKDPDLTPSSDRYLPGWSRRVP